MLCPIFPREHSTVGHSWLLVTWLADWPTVGPVLANDRMVGDFGPLTGSQLLGRLRICTFNICWANVESTRFLFKMAGSNNWGFNETFINIWNPIETANVTLM